MIHQGSAGFQGTPTDIEIHAKEVLSLRRRMAEIIAQHSGKPYDQVEKDIDRDRFMTSEEAKAYGIIDEVIESRTAAERQGGALIQGEPTRLLNEDSEPSMAERAEA
jgi:ATP-dependent Clp protease protease subunit